MDFQKNSPAENYRDFQLSATKKVASCRSAEPILVRQQSEVTLPTVAAQLHGQRLFAHFRARADEDWFRAPTRIQLKTLISV